MIKSKEELLNQIREVIGENVESDAGIELIENVSDTYADLEDKNQDSWKEKYEDMKKKYTERFFNSDGKDPEEKHTDPDEKPPVPKFEDLFKIN